MDTYTIDLLLQLVEGISLSLYWLAYISLATIPQIHNFVMAELSLIVRTSDGSDTPK